MSTYFQYLLFSLSEIIGDIGGLLTGLFSMLSTDVFDELIWDCTRVDSEDDFKLADLSLYNRCRRAPFKRLKRAN